MIEVVWLVLGALICYALGVYTGLVVAGLCNSAVDIETEE